MPIAPSRPPGRDVFYQARLDIPAQLPPLSSLPLCNCRTDFPSDRLQTEEATPVTIVY